MNRVQHWVVRDGTKIIQWNLRQSLLSLQTIIEYARRKDTMILLLQDVPKEFTSIIHGYFGFQRFIYQGDSTPLTTILVRRIIVVHDIGTHSSRTTGAIIQTQHSIFGLISACIQHTSGGGLSELTNAVKTMNSNTSFFLIDFDSNGRSPLWGSAHIEHNHVGELIEDFIRVQGLHPINSQDSLPSFISDRGGAILD